MNYTDKFDGRSQHEQIDLICQADFSLPGPHDFFNLRRDDLRSVFT